MKLVGYGLIERLLKFLRGDDVFLSYSRADGATYAAGLANELAKRNFSCRFDQWGTEPGAKMPKQLMSALRRSAMLVLVGTKGAAQSTHVAHEVREFKRTDRRIVPIVFDGVQLAGGLTAHEGDLDAASAAPGGTDVHALWAREVLGLPVLFEQAGALTAGNPSEAALNRIDKNVTFWRRDKRLRVATGVVAFVLVLLVAAAGLVGLYASRTAIEVLRQQGIAAGRLICCSVQTESFLPPTLVFMQPFATSPA